MYASTTGRYQVKNRVNNGDTYVNIADEGGG